MENTVDKIVRLFTANVLAIISLIVISCLDISVDMFDAYIALISLYVGLLAK